MAAAAPDLRHNREVMTRWPLPLLFLLMLATATPASAITVPDVIELVRAGVPASVINAMIDSDGTVFTVGKRQLLRLRAAGVPDDVILKMLRTRQVDRAKARRAASEGISAGDAAYPPPSTIAARVGDTPGLVIIGGADALPPPLVIPQSFPTYVVPWVPWGVPLDVGRASRESPKPFLSEEARGFGRFINDGVR